MYKDETLAFQGLLENDGSVTIHDRNLRKLAIEMFKVKKNLSPSPVIELFKERPHIYNLKNERCWEVPLVQTVNFGKEPVRYRGIQTWDLLPQDIKDSESPSVFKGKIKEFLSSVKSLLIIYVLCSTQTLTTTF